ncbi:RNA polymerase-associated protein RTF1 homolog isoform X1 [Drosophila mauritiana]|uniref:RNA polymerase-associated protein RTF1 homolog isoform X1 n=1 Tax=Drosophila mauritiana TaxID=7226 RepID=A0A6P8L7D8_DROMA|nr:RNA polymerase-associated protein RTF1 homolog isoform X1 [Drosophila mauritiana]
MDERSRTRRKITKERESGGKTAHAFERLLAIRNNKLSKEKCSEDRAEQTKASNDCQTQKHTDLNIEVKETYSGDSSPNSERDNAAQNDPQTKVESEERVSNLEQLSRAVLKRSDIKNLLDKPIFAEAVIGSFVRLNVGKIYCIYETIALHQDRKDYRVDGKRTNLILVLRCGSEKRYSRIDVVSNQPITQKEFLLWLETNLRNRCTLPTLNDIAKKQVQVKNACKYSYTETDVEKLIQAKREAGIKQNAAYRKISLIIERDMAAGMNDVEKVQVLEKKILEIDEEPRTQLEKSGQHRYQVLSSTRVVHVPTIYRHELGVPSGGKRSFDKRTAKPDQHELEKYMRRKYKKSAVVSRSRFKETFEDCGDSSAMVNKSHTENQKKEGDAETETEKMTEEDLNLQRLNTFNIELDTTGLVPFHEIFPNVKFNSPWDEIMKG